jgi:hypothetical protein
MWSCRLAGEARELEGDGAHGQPCKSSAGSPALCSALAAKVQAAIHGED